MTGQNETVIASPGAVLRMNASGNQKYISLNNPQRETYLLTYMPNEGSNHHAHPDQSLCCPYEETAVFVIRNAPSEDSDQSARVRRLI